MGEEFVRVLREVTLVGEIVLDPAYDPPWPGAGITSVRKDDDDTAAQEDREDGDG